MLYGYPIEATVENWLHDVLCDIIRAVNTKVAANEDLPKWPLIVPTPHRVRLKSRHGLKRKINVLKDALKGLTNPERARVIQALSDQNNIPALVTCTADCSKLLDLPASVQDPIKDLFIFAFDLLSDLGIRDRHYAIIYNALEYPICPFCGLEYFDAPGAPREDYDHYLLKDDYPFAAANLRNLAPMGGKCNSGYKKMQDMLKKGDGTRRKSFDPYNHPGLSVSLEGSEPFEGKDGQIPRWQIDFIPTTEESSTWEEIFHVRERYIRDVLDPSFKSWLRAFRTWCRSAPIAPASGPELVEAIERYAITLEDQGISDRAFIKVAVFRMLQKQCRDDNERVISLLLNAVNS